MKLLCDADFAEGELSAVLDSIPITFKNYYLTLGPKKIRNLQYKNSILLSEYEKIKNNQDNSTELANEIYNTFKIGDRYLKSEIKCLLKSIYNKFKLTSTPKSLDILKYFETKRIQVIDPITNKKLDGYELISKKE
jgi:hypothetical protein